ncbi:MAG: hypothetical protein IJY39_09010 [Clostridia bacterium]|nr:hypothetical protein [Clostridia bacterium]
MIIKSETIDEICKHMSEILISFGFQEITVNDRKNYECDGQFYRLTPMYKNRTILLEAAESLALAQVNAYEDAGWYDLSGTPPISDEEKHKLLEKFRGDIVLYFIADNFDKYLRSNSFKKAIREGLVSYSSHEMEVKTYFDENTAIWKIWIQKQNELYERAFSPIEPNKTVYEIKSFVKQYLCTDR